MKLLLVLLIAGYTKASSFQDDLESIGIVQAIAVNALASVSHKCPNATRQHLREEEIKAVECIKNIRYNSSFCTTFIHHFKPCVQTILTEAKCEESDKTEIKHIILDSVIAEAEFICETDGEHILEIINPCVFKSIHGSKECRRNVLDTSKGSISPTVFCSKYSDLQRCFNDQLQQKCENEITKSSMHDLFSVDVKPCNIVMGLFFELGRFSYHE